MRVRELSRAIRRSTSTSRRPTRPTAWSCCCARPTHAPARPPTPPSRCTRTRRTSSCRASCRFAISGRPRSRGGWRRPLCSCRNQIVDPRRARAAGAPAAPRRAVGGDAGRAAPTRAIASSRWRSDRWRRSSGASSTRRPPSSSGWSRRSAAAGIGRIGACAGIELLRAEVAAIEDGAAHRLSLVCEELREKMTVQLVRLVLEQSRSLRQELLRKRHEVARGRSPKVEETFDDMRLACRRRSTRPSPPCARPSSASS